MRGLEPKLLNSQIEHSNRFLDLSLSLLNDQTSLSILMVQGFHRQLEPQAGVHQEAGPTVTNLVSGAQVVTLHQNPVSHR